MLTEALGVTTLVGKVLDDLGVPWLVGGSIASSLQGVPRATQDVDLVAALQLIHIKPFSEALEEGFYVSEDAIRDAIRRRSSFNLIHLDTMTKVDVFVLKADPLSQSELRRRWFFKLEDGSQLPLASAEDIILQKLHWYRKGEQTSERQMRDVFGGVAGARQRSGFCLYGGHGCSEWSFRIVEKSTGSSQVILV